MPIHASANARIGLLGNPSDGYFGRTIACTIDNFAATVELNPSRRLTLIPNPAFDPTEFDSLDGLSQTVRRDGYYGGLRLIYATCKKFAEFCEGHEIPLRSENFSLRYNTTIPRQVGLAGSSAIITATVRALRAFYDIGDDLISKNIQPNLVLSVEEEDLDIRAGLQDRVAQTWGGLVYMDFDRELLETRGYGEYESIELDELPLLFLVYTDKPKDSGKVHSDVRARWHQGDAAIIDGMEELAQIAADGKTALTDGDFGTLSALMDRNFGIRLRMFGEDVIGAENMKMINIAREEGASAKFCGSGGAIVGLCESKTQFDRLHNIFGRRGYSFARIAIAGSTSASST